VTDEPPEGLDALERETPPPPLLKQRVLRTLHERGLLRHGRRPWGMIGAVAASLALFALGLAIGRRTPPAGAPDVRPQFLLLLYQQGRGPATDTIAQVQEYVAWAQALRRQGGLGLGEELAESAQLVTAERSQAMRVPVPAEGPGALVGFFIVRAADAEEAGRIARTNPHLRYGGSIVIRPIKPT
jgi:hypothetical protein